ncbi:MAG: hypothetical protein K0R10_2392 [Alphaproteobacteria bacterium]|nr:hypothetical protein [Alphaproteobacteria bacterium]
MGMQPPATSAPMVTGPAGFTVRHVKAGSFTLTAHEKVRTPGQVAAVYIGGDGPDAGVAPALAAKDKSANVIFLTRPCQNGAACADEFRGSKRFSSEVISAVSKALDALKKQHNFYGFNLVGFAAGATVATLVAAERQDVLSLRTVAGNLDTAAYGRLHRLPSLEGSLNPKDVSAKLLPLGQKHFIGARDKIIPAEVGNSYIEASGRPDCVGLTVVDSAGHTEGWAEIWPELLEQPLQGGC